MATCRSCDAVIEWVLTEKAKRMPIDALPVADGNLTMDRDERGNLKMGPNGILRVRAVKAGEELPAETSRYVSHFATCPDAAKHKKPRQ
jgi:hypothetical protein